MTRLLLVLLVISGSCRPSSDRPDGARPIFRHFNTELSTIRLGQSWTAEEVPGAEPGDTVVVLPSGTFPRAQAVRVHRTPAGVVSSIMLDYPQTADFGAMQAEYRRLFGPPMEHVQPTGPEARESIVWQDSLTRFELVREPTSSAAAIFTRMSDRSLLP